MIRNWLRRRDNTADALVLHALTEHSQLSAGPLKQATNLGPLRCARAVQRLLAAGRIADVGYFLPTDFGGQRSTHRYTLTREGR
jgi:hypothetical protein